MTSPIPNYSETVAIGEIQAADIHHQFSDKDLVGFVDPGNGQHFPPASDGSIPTPTTSSQPSSSRRRPA